MAKMLYSDYGHFAWNQVCRRNQRIVLTGTAISFAAALIVASSFGEKDDEEDKEEQEV